MPEVHSVSQVRHSGEAGVKLEGVGSSASRVEVRQASKAVEIITAARVGVVLVLFVLLSGLIASAFSELLVEAM